MSLKQLLHSMEGSKAGKESLIDAAGPKPTSAGFSLSLLVPTKDGWSWASGEPLFQFVSMGSFLICFCIMICAFIVIGGSGGGTSGPMPANNWTLSPLSQQLPCLNFDISG